MSWWRAGCAILAVLASYHVTYAARALNSEGTCDRLEGPHDTEFAEGTKEAEAIQDVTADRFGTRKIFDKLYRTYRKASSETLEAEGRRAGLGAAVTVCDEDPLVHGLQPVDQPLRHRSGAEAG